MLWLGNDSLLVFELVDGHAHRRLVKSLTKETEMVGWIRVGEV